MLNLCSFDHNDVYLTTEHLSCFCVGEAWTRPIGWSRYQWPAFQLMKWSLSNAEEMTYVLCLMISETYHYLLPDIIKF